MRRNGHARTVLLLCAFIGGSVLVWHYAPLLSQSKPPAAPTAALIVLPPPGSPPVEGATTTPPASLLLPVATTTGVLIPVANTYIEVVDSCGPYYGGTCVNMRQGPGTQYPIVMRLRTGMVLKIEGIMADEQGAQWYKIDLGEDIRYPERITSNWYVSADAVQAFVDTSEGELGPKDHPSSTKRIVVSKSKQMLYAYDGDTLFMQEAISTGLDSTPTPLGTFTVYKKTPSRYMQGPLPGVSDQVYDLPGVPWNLYFTTDGAVVHGAYWHNHFGEPWSHGCVNLPPEKAKELYEWAQLGMKVTIVP